MLIRNTAFAAIILISVMAPLGHSQDDSNPQAAVQKLAREVEEKVSQVRGLAYLSPTKVGVHSEAALRDFLTKEVDKELTPEIAGKHERCMVMLGLYRRTTDLRKTVLALLAEQVAGFYNPEKKALFLIRREASDKAGAAQDRLIMSHELVHALQDQHFDLTAFMAPVDANDDQTSARKALVEGDATWAMMAFKEGPKQASMMMGPLMPTDLAGLKPLIEMAKKMGLEGVSDDSLNMDALFAAPMVDGDEMIFSYYGGAKFCAYLIKNGGVSQVDKAYSRPPQSTEQILHPPKYDKEYDAPQDVRLPNLSDLLGPEFKKVSSNTLGELRMRSWLTGFGYKAKKKRAVHSGWDGDTYAVYGAHGRSDALVWGSIWDTELDAQEFVAVAKEILAKMEPEAQKRDNHLQLLGLMSGIVRRGNRVFFLRRMPTNKWDQVLNTLFNSTEYKEVSRSKKALK